MYKSLIWAPKKVNFPLPINNIFQVITPKKTSFLAVVIALAYTSFVLISNSFDTQVMLNLILMSLHIPVLF